MTLVCENRRRIWPPRACLDIANYADIESALVYAKQKSDELGGIPVRLLDTFGNDVISHPPPEPE